MVAPRSGPAEARPSLRRIWTVPKHEAAMNGYSEIAGAEPHVAAAQRQQDGAGDDDQRAADDGQGHPLAQEQDGEHAGHQRGHVVDGGRHRRADLLDGEDAEEPAAGGADQAREGEVGDRLPRVCRRSGTSRSGGRPRGDRADDDVDPGARVEGRAPQPAVDEDGRGRGAQGTRQRHHVRRRAATRARRISRLRRGGGRAAWRAARSSASTERAPAWKIAVALSATQPKPMALSAATRATTASWSA